jgi:RNase P/RNase MRP subunit p30
MEIVFPDRNENEFIEMALRLGYKEICFAYEENKLPAELPKTNKLTIKTAILNPKNPGRAKNKSRILISDENARTSFEKSEIDIVFGLEAKGKTDFNRQRNSGLNQVLCQIAAKKNKTYGFNFRDVLIAKNRPAVIGRMMQNMMLCRKYKVKTIIFSGAKEPMEMRNGRDLDSFLNLF